MFEDTEFPTGAQLGDSVEGRLGGKLQFRRPAEFSNAPHLFNTIEPSDVRQGALGDCWLISSLSSVAEFPAIIKHLFKSDDLSADGKYVCRIYDPEVKQFVEVEVDDLIPCWAGGSPAFAQSNAGEFWPCIIEKAFAKWVGSYSKLSGGWPALALTAITGSQSELYTFGTQIKCLNFGDLTVKKAANLEGGASIFSDGEAFEPDAFWAKLVEFDHKDYLMTLATPGTDSYSEAEGPSEDFGIVGGHAYSLIAVKDVQGFKLCQIRNPWGDFEWGGDWSDRSDLWDKHPDVRLSLGHSLDKDDGLFWMPFHAVLTRFTSVTVNLLNREKARSWEVTSDSNGVPEWLDGFKQSADNLLGFDMKSLPSCFASLLALPLTFCAAQDDSRQD